MRKNGFTLVELLVVVVILGLIGLVTVPAVSKIIRDARKDKESINIDTILNAGYDFIQKNPSYMPVIPSNPTETTVVEGTKFCTQQLVCEGLLKSEIATSESVDDFKGHSIKVTYYHQSPTEEIENSKFFGHYLLTYQEDSSCSTYQCTGSNPS